MNRTHTKRRLPPIPRPPHDPTWWKLGARAGWRGAVLQGLENVSGALALAPVPASRRVLTEASGSFGGLTLPTNVALAPDGSLYLLDHAALQLKRFDPCTCRFEVVPCLGGEGAEPRQLQDPGGIAIRGGNLYVCDTGNHRLSVFALPEGVLRAQWTPPQTADLPNDWTPYDVAFDRHGQIHVTDPANGYVHRFSPAGLWDRGISGMGRATHLAIDDGDRLYIVVEDEVRVLDPTGQPLEIDRRVEALRDDFPELPFEVDAEGRLYLEGLCPDSPPSREGTVTIFDEVGQRMTVEEPDRGLRFNRAGRYISQPLDSERHRCQWHRIVLHGTVPEGTFLKISTHTANARLSEEHVENLPERAWETNLTVHDVDEDGWGGLVQSERGRYLWLRLQFQGNGVATPEIRSVEVEFPRISLRRYLPAVFGEDPVGADFTDRFLSIFDATLRGIEHQIDTQARLFDPASAPAEKDAATGTSVLSWLASWIGAALDRQWPEAKRRRFLKRAGQLFCLRGTREGLWRSLLLYLDMEPETVCCPDDAPKTRCRTRPGSCQEPEESPCTWQAPPLILEHFRLRRWLFLGDGRLGDQAVLWGKRIVGRSQLDENAQIGGTQLSTAQDPFRDPFHVYAHKFSVFVPASYERSPRHRRSLENVVQTGKPAHTQAQIVYVAPRFRIGFQSMIGLDAVVGRYPEGVTLDETSLGSASVLGDGPQQRDISSIRVGKASRIGTTTTLD